MPTLKPSKAQMFRCLNLQTSYYNCQVRLLVLWVFDIIRRPASHDFNKVDSETLFSVTPTTLNSFTFLYKIYTQLSQSPEKADMFRTIRGMLGWVYTFTNFWSNNVLTFFTMLQQYEQIRLNNFVHPTTLSQFFEQLPDAPNPVNQIGVALIFESDFLYRFIQTICYTALIFVSSQTLVGSNLDQVKKKLKHTINIAWAALDVLSKIQVDKEKPISLRDDPRVQQLGQTFSGQPVPSQESPNMLTRLDLMLPKVGFLENNSCTDGNPNFVHLKLVPNILEVWPYNLGDFVDVITREKCQPDSIMKQCTRCNRLTSVKSTSPSSTASTTATSVTPSAPTVSVPSVAVPSVVPSGLTPSQTPANSPVISAVGGAAGQAVEGEGELSPVYLWGNAWSFACPICGGMWKYVVTKD